MRTTAATVTLLRLERRRSGAQPLGRMLDRLSLRVKLVGITALGILFVVAVSVVALSGLHAPEQTSRKSAVYAEAQRIHSAVLLRLGSLRTDLIAARLGDGAVPPAAPIADGRSRSAIEDDATAAQALIADLSALDLHDEALAKGAAAFAERTTAAVEAARQAAAGTPVAEATLTTALTDAGTASAAFATQVDGYVRDITRHAASDRASARLDILLAAGLAVLALLLASHFLSMSIIRALRRIGEAAQAVGGGHLTARTGIDTSDEIGRVGKAFDDVADSLTSLLVKMESDAKHADFGRQLGEALEMVDSEDDVRRVVEQAFALVDPDAPMELLLADSSQAHLERTAESPTAGGAGCTVVSPYSCMAVRKGVATSFDTSDALNACHKLRGRPGGSCSAVCVPVSFMGRSLGVLHAIGPAGIPPTGEVQRQLVTLSRHTGMRIGTVRAFAKNQLQASTDSLTGLLNRRTLENRLRELLKARTPFALTMVDLDRFKQLNDTFGHEAGDRALRLFAGVVRDTLRDGDVCGRMGGEEFVIVLRDLDVERALPALERLREHLAETLGSGTGPVFTASFGITDSTAGSTIEDLLRIADAGLLRAKAEGRDRVVVGTAADAAALVARAA